MEKLASTRTSRRRVMKGAAVAAGGLAAGYVKPNMQSLGVLAAHARVSAPPPPPPDITPPLCAWTFRQWAPGQPSFLPAALRGNKYVEVTIQDPQSGLSHIVYHVALNVQFHNNTFAPGTTTPVVFTATKINNSARSQVDITVYDLAGNSTRCDPIFDEIVAGSTEVYSGVPEYEYVVSIVNGAVGLTSVDIMINGNPVSMTGLAPGSVSHISVQQYMVPGPNNTFVVTPNGPAGATADIVIANVTCVCA